MNNIYPRVLVVSSVLETSKEMKDIVASLKGRGFRVTTCRYLSQVSEFLEKSKYESIFLDVLAFPNPDYEKNIRDGWTVAKLAEYFNKAVGSVQHGTKLFLLFRDHKADISEATQISGYEAMFCLDGKNPSFITGFAESRICGAY